MIISPDTFRVRPNGYYDSSFEATAAAWDRTFREFRHALDQKNPLRVVLLVGLPGSGKSTWTKHNDHDDHIIIDATLTRKIERAPLIQLAQYQQIDVEALVFLTPMIDCMFRNAERSPDRRVPHNVLARMVENMQTDPVTLEEGFEWIHAVRHKVRSPESPTRTSTKRPS